MPNTATAAAAIGLVSFGVELANRPCMQDGLPEACGDHMYWVEPSPTGGVPSYKRRRINVPTSSGSSMGREAAEETILDAAMVAEDARRAASLLGHPPGKHYFFVI